MYMYILGRICACIYMYNIYIYIFRDTIDPFPATIFASLSGKTHQSLLSVKDQSDIARKEYADFLRVYYTQHELSSSKWPHAPKYINLYSSDQQ